jgi:hypothetical protein
MRLEPDGLADHGDQPLDMLTPVEGESAFRVGACKGHDRDIDIAADIHQEFSEWDWVPLSELASLILPFKRRIHGRAAAEFAPLAKPAKN